MSFLRYLRSSEKGPMTPGRGSEGRGGRVGKSQLGRRGGTKKGPIWGRAERWRLSNLLLELGERPVRALKDALGGTGKVEVLDTTLALVKE